VSHIQTVDLVHTALALAGHGDVLTREAVRHVLRAMWRKRHADAASRTPGSASLSRPDRPLTSAITR
jgi:hypothetical protein